MERHTKTGTLDWKRQNAGIFDDTMLNVRNCAGFEISRQPLCCAVSIHHRLADKNRLAVQDLYGENLMLMHRDWSHSIPYGLLHSPVPSETVKRFLSAVQTVRHQ